MTELQFKPVGAKIIAERDPQERVTGGGIILPDTTNNPSFNATVVAVGPGTRKDDGTYLPCECEVGNRVLIGKWAGTNITDPANPKLELVLLDEREVIGRY